MENQRSSGKTTRLVDDYIQQFFTEPLYTPITIHDHLVNGKRAPRESNIELLKKIEERLKHEHPTTKYYASTEANIWPTATKRRLEIPGLCEELKFTDKDKECVIMRTSDTVSDIRARQYQYYLEEVSRYETNKEYINNMWPPSLTDFMLVDRVRGYSTRLADKYIQEFFSKEPGDYVEIKDHYRNGEMGEANARLLDTIIGRLKNEHNARFYVHRGTVPKLVKVEK